jgi:hypothetical protein
MVMISPLPILLVILLTVNKENLLRLPLIHPNMSLFYHSIHTKTTHSCYCVYFQQPDPHPIILKRQLSSTLYLSSPQPSDEFSQANVVGIELIASHKSSSGAGVESSSHDFAKDRCLARVEVVYRQKKRKSSAAVVVGVGYPSLTCDTSIEAYKEGK